jgi:hypothetical protein
MDGSSAATWHATAAAFDELDRPYVSAYCRWREAEAHVDAGAPRGTAAVPAACGAPGRARPARTALARPARAPRATRAALPCGAVGVGTSRSPVAARVGARHHRTGGGSARARGARVHKSGDRRVALRQRQDGERPRHEHPPEAWRLEPPRGRRRRAAGRRNFLDARSESQGGPRGSRPRPVPPPSWRSSEPLPAPPQTAWIAGMTV